MSGADVDVPLTKGKALGRYGTSTQVEQSLVGYGIKLLEYVLIRVVHSGWNW